MRRKVDKEERGMDLERGIRESGQAQSVINKLLYRLITEGVHFNTLSFTRPAVLCPFSGNSVMKIKL